MVRLDGEEVYRRDALTTRTQIGLADTFELSVGGDAVALEVSLPKRSLDRATTITLTDPTYVGLSLERGALLVRVQRDPFGYA